MKMSRSEAALVGAAASARARRARVNKRYAARLRADGWTCTPPNPPEQTTCYCDDLEYASLEHDDAPDGVCRCGHTEDEHTHEGDRAPCTARQQDTNSAPNSGGGS